MTKYLIPALAAAAAMLPATAATAQTVPDAKVGVVDVEAAIRTCTACATAWTQLEQQGQQVQAFAQQQRAPLQTESQQLDAEARALNGAEPSADLQQRIGAFRQRAAQVDQQIQQRAAVLQRNQNYVLQQIGAQLDPAYAAVLAARRVNLIVPKNSTLANAPAVDLTNDVVAQLNRTLTSVATVAPATQPPAQPTQQPQGR